MAVEFLILGPLEIRHDGAPLELGGTRRRALIAALLLRAGELVPADALIQALWGEEAAPSAANALQAHVSRARRDLGPLAGRLRDRGRRLPARRRARRAGRRALRARLRGRARAAGRRARGRGRGDAGRGARALARRPRCRSSTYAQAEVRRLEELRLLALEERIEAELALGEHGRAAGELEPLIAEHPLRERLRGQHMLALYRLGRHADALAAYRDLRERLDRELGLEPGPELRELEQAILDPPRPAARRRAARAGRRRRSGARTTCAGSPSCWATTTCGC